MGGDAATSDTNNTLRISEQKGKSRKRLLAELGMSSVLTNTNTTRSFAKAAVGELNLTEAVAVMREKVSAVNAGNLDGLEETLIAQAVSLNAIFNEMARRAYLNMGEHLNATDIYLRLGLKAQAQCRATLQTLSDMKSPQPIAFVKQANIANGLQQVNNGLAPAGSASRGEIPGNRSNELLGLNHEQRLDTSTQGAAGGTHCHVEAMGAVVRSED
jgi:hypothetical protein